MTAVYYGRGGGSTLVTFAAVQSALAAATGAVSFNGQNITAGTLNGVDVTALSSPDYTAVAAEAITLGALIQLKDAAGTPKFYLADADGAGLLQDSIGYAEATAAPAANTTARYTGTVVVPDANWDAVPVAGDVGKRVYLSATAGKSTLVAPSASGSTALRVGKLLVGGAGVCKVLIGIGEGQVL